MVFVFLTFWYFNGIFVVVAHIDCFCLDPIVLSWLSSLDTDLPKYTRSPVGGEHSGLSNIPFGYGGEDGEEFPNWRSG